MSSADRPLDGITVLVTRPRDQGERLCALIETAGGRAVSLPAMVIRTLDGGETRRALREAVSECSDIIFVSRNAVGCALELHTDLAAALAHKRVYAAGAGTRQALADAGIDGVLYTEATRASEALLEMPELSAERIRDKRLAVIRGEGGRDKLPEALRRHGAAVRLVELYRRGRYQRAHCRRSRVVGVYSQARGRGRRLGRGAGECRGGRRGVYINE